MDFNSNNPASPRSRQTVLTFSATGQLQARPPSTPNLGDRDELIKAAKETLSVLPGLLLTRPDAQPDGYLCEKDRVSLLNMSFCPNLPQTKIRVINLDSIDVALALNSSRSPSDKPVCILNMANAVHAGGGFRSGALAQEEALCYRTSLSFTLKLRHYPIPDKAAIYSPNVLVIRHSLANGHGILDCRDPSKLPVISVVSAAAIYNPLTRDSGKKYADVGDAQLMADKMRVILRTAIRNKHRKIVLGAFGCGAFRNPPEAVCGLWADVLLEPEFAGGWWEDVIFAVLSGRDRNYQIFHEKLDGLVV